MYLRKAHKMIIMAAPIIIYWLARATNSEDMFSSIVVVLKFVRDTTKNKGQSYRS